MSAFPFLYYIVNPPSTGFVFKPQLSMAQDGVHDAHGNQPGIIWNLELCAGVQPTQFPCISAFTLNDSSHVRFQQMSTEGSRNCLMDLSCTSHLEPGSCTSSRVGKITGLLPMIDHWFSLVFEIRNHFRQSSYLLLTHDLQDLLI